MTWAPDMTGFDTLAHTLIPASAANNPESVVPIGRHATSGFVNYDKEWWHFTFKPGTVPRHILRLPHRLAAQLARDLGELSLAELFDQVDRYRSLAAPSNSIVVAALPE